MGKVVDTTNIVDTTYLLSQTPKNLVPDNYWLRELQEKVDADWRFRPNRVDVEEETGPGEEEYTPLEVVIQSVRDDKGTKVSDDWRRVVFRDIFKKCRIGQRFRFSYNFDLEEPDELKSIWIAVNQDSASPTAQQVISRCNGTIGSIWVDENGNKSYHYEPVVQTTDLKTVSMYFSQVAVDPRGSLTILAQHNKYTSQYYINQRFVIGYDTVYKVKNIIKTGSLTTYDPYDVGVMQIYLDLDSIGKLDNFETRIAYNGREDEELEPEPQPPVEDPDEEGVEWQLLVSEPSPLPTELYSSPIEFKVYLFKNGEQSNEAVKVETSLDKTELDDMYYELAGVDDSGYAIDNSFSLRRKKIYSKAKLKVKVFVPAEESPTGAEMSYEFELGLRGLE